MSHLSKCQPLTTLWTHEEGFKPRKNAEATPRASLPCGSALLGKIRARYFVEITLIYFCGKLIRHWLATHLSNTSLGHRAQRRDAFVDCQSTTKTRERPWFATFCQPLSATTHK